MKEFLNSVITLDNGNKWYICDQTEQENDKYYLAVKLDKDHNPEPESKIFKEVKEEGKVYLDDKIEPEKYKLLVAIFISNLVNKSEEIRKGILEEENEEVE